MTGKISYDICLILLSSKLRVTSWLSVFRLYTRTVVSLHFGSYLIFVDQILGHYWNVDECIY
jgi:hypothetical protein